LNLLHRALASCGAVYCNRSCLWVRVFAMGGVQTSLQPARTQCLRLSEHFFIFIVFFFNSDRRRPSVH